MGLFIQLIEHLTNLICMVFMVRILLQIAQADFNNPVAQFVHKFTFPVINPLRSIIPDMGKFNTASLIAAVVVLGLKFFVISLVLKATLSMEVLLVGALIGLPSFAGLIINFVTLLTILFIGLMVTSFMAGGHYNPVLMFFHQVTRPLLSPLQKIIPPIGGAIDITPMILLFVLLYLQRVLVTFAMQLIQ